MTGFEARPMSLPLQPRNFESRQPAILSRTEIPFTSTEKFRTGTEGLFTAVKAELATTRHYVPEASPFPKDPNQVLVVAVASNNNRKIDSIIGHISNHPVDIIRIPEAEEMHTKDTIIDATSKALDAVRVINESQDDVRREVRTRPFVTIANDQLNSIPVIFEDPATHMPTIRFERLGKPQNDEHENPVDAVRETVQKLTEAAQTHDWKSIPYIIELATVIHNPKDPDDNAVSVQKTVVFLSRDGLRQLSTDRFDEYVEKVSQKYDITAIAGGLELQVLGGMGIVEFISGTISEIEPNGFPPLQRPEATEHAISLALGTADARLIEDYFGDRRN